MMESNDNEHNHKPNAMEQNRLTERETLSTKRTDYNSIVKDNITTDPGYVNALAEIHQTNYFQKQFEDSFYDIRSAELEVKNGIPEKYEMDGKQSLEKVQSPVYHVKSYLQDFYCTPDKEILKNSEFMQGDDFRFLAEPRRKKNCWVRAGLWIGVNLTVLGVLALLVGYLTPPRQAIVWQMPGYTILDRWAVTFNNRLIICQLAGMVSFLCGTIVVCCSLLLTSCESQRVPTYYVMGGTAMPENLVGSPRTDPLALHRIPISGTIKGVQPNFLVSQY